MPNVSRGQNTDPCTGHGCFPPRTCPAGSNNVITNGKPTLREKVDIFKPHACPNVPPHAGNISKGSGSVFVNKKGVAREMDPISCGSFIRTGSGNVNAGDSTEKYTPPKFPEIKFSPIPHPDFTDSQPSNTESSGGGNISQLPPSEGGLGLPDAAEIQDENVEELSSRNCEDVPLRNPFDVAYEAMTTRRWTEQGNNQNIISLWKEVGLGQYAFLPSGGYNHWCAVFVGATLKRSGHKHLASATARNYEGYGTPVGWDDIQRGDIIVFWRSYKNSGKGHVGIATGNKTDTTIEIIGGNQSDNLTIRNYSRGPSSDGKAGWSAARRPVPCVQSNNNSLISNINLESSGGSVVQIGEGSEGAVS